MGSKNGFPTKAAILAAADRIAPFIRRTPVLTSHTLNEMSGAELFFKCENFQKVGAFKIRGAMNAVLLLKEGGDVAAVATHSSGNHAQALALAAATHGLKAFIVMPENAPAVKRKAVEGYGAEVISCAPNLQAREEKLAEVVARTGATFVPPFDDDNIICGQATVAMELLQEISYLDWVVAPVGGGGLLSGTALAAHYFSEGVRVAAGEPEGANDAYLSMLQQKLVTLKNPKSIADGLLTSLSVRTFEIIARHVSQVFAVEEQEIVDAMKLVWERMKIVIEPSGAVALAALLKNKGYFAGKRVGVIFSGGNVELTKLPF